MKSLLPTFFLVCFLIVLSVDAYSFNAPLAEDRLGVEEFVTKEGVITSSSEPKINLMDGQMYIITGTLAAELRQLSGFRVRVSGTIVKNDERNLTGYYNVLRYTNLEDGVVGNIRRSHDGLVLIGEDQVIYGLNVPEKMRELRELVDCKVFMKCWKEINTQYRGSIYSITETVFLRRLEPARIGTYVTLEGKAYLDGSEPLLELVLSTKQGRYVLKKLYIGYADDIVVTGLWTDGYKSYAKGVVEVENYSLKTSDPHGVLYYVNDKFVLLGEDQVVYRINNPSDGHYRVIPELPTTTILSGIVKNISEYEATIDVGTTSFPGRYYFKH